MMFANYLKSKGVVVTTRGTRVFNSIEFVGGLILFFLLIGWAGGIEAGTIKLPWGL